jgi:WNK lysine deficient protein kinase
LANVTKRLSAKELLLDPFLATAQHDSPLPNPTLPSKHSQKLNFNATMAKEQPSLNVQTKSTHMTITGTMNEEDDNVFLKVKISNKNGMYSFIKRYFSKNTKDYLDYYYMFEFIV